MEIKKLAGLQWSASLQPSQVDSTHWSYHVGERKYHGGVISIRDFAERFVKAEDDAFQNGDFTALSKLEHPDVVYHFGAPLGDIVGHEAHKKDIMDTRQACADVKQEWKYLAGDGNLFAMSYESSGRFIAEKPGFPAPIGKSISSNSLFVLLTQNEQVVEVWARGTMNIT